MTREEMRKQIEKTADNLYGDGFGIAINYSLPWVSIVYQFRASDEPKSYHFAQGDEAIELLDEAYRASNKFKVSDEDWIMFHLESAGVFDK